MDMLDKTRAMLLEKATKRQRAKNKAKDEMGAQHGSRTPKGFSPIPHGKKGGFRKKTAKGWTYWYPGSAAGGKATHGGKIKGGYNESSHVDDQLAKYNLTISGADVDPVRAEKVAGDLKEVLRGAIKNSADLCKMDPSFCEGNLGIPRRDMPQLDDKPPKKGSWKEKAYLAAGGDPNSKKGTLDILKERLADKGIKVTKGKTPVGKMRATQAEIQAGKTISMADSQLKGYWVAPDGTKKPTDLTTDPIMVTSDGFILDGHHRWSAMLTISPDVSMTTETVDIKMEDLLKMAFDIPGVYRAHGLDAELDGKKHKKDTENTLPMSARAKEVLGKMDKGTFTGMLHVFRKAAA